MKKVSSIPELLEKYGKCRICAKNTEFSIIITTYKGKSIKDKLSSYFDKSLNSKTEDIKYKFNREDKFVNVGELNLKIDLVNNIVLTDNEANIFNDFNLSIECNHDILGKEYIASGSIISELDVEDINSLMKDGMYKIPVSEIELRYEQYLIYNLHLDEDPPNGNIIKITNDYYINKTSFSIAETNLDGTMGSWKEKRIDLVEDDFFKFDKSERVYSRVNAIFLIK